MSRVPVTGIGIVAPGAIGVDAFRALLAGGVTAIVPAGERWNTDGLSAQSAGLVRDFKARDYIPPMKLRRMNALSRFALAAAKMALDDSGLAPAEETGVALGTAFGPVQTSVEYMAEYVAKGAALAPPQLFAESVANAPGSHIAIEHNLRGFNVTVTQRESSALAAAMYACTQIIKGTVPAALAGGTEELNEMIYSVLDRIGALAHAAGGADGCMRPFDRRRNGLLPGEGSAVLALGRGPRAYAWLSGFGMARDTTATISDWGDDAHAVATAMRNALADAELDVSEVDAVFASANSTTRADRVEARAIAELFGARIPAVAAVKGFFGEYAGGGALQLAAAVLAVADQKLPATAGFEQGDDDLPFAPTRAAADASLRHVLVNSVSAGGGVVSAVVSREDA
jgi:3-oxoacyl-[acyl-carrier-protein] synthase II